MSPEEMYSRKKIAKNCETGLKKIEDRMKDIAGVAVEDSGGIAKTSKSTVEVANVGTWEYYSRKVFVGGLPPDICEEEIFNVFRKFGPVVVDWPHKARSSPYFPPKGFACLIYQEETSVRKLMESCVIIGNKFCTFVSSPTIKDKLVQVKPWKLSDSEVVLSFHLAIDSRMTVFVGGIPRAMKAVELANFMNYAIGGVIYASIFTDWELNYPKGAGCVAFSNPKSYMDAVMTGFILLSFGNTIKWVEVKPYICIK